MKTRRVALSTMLGLIALGGVGRGGDAPKLYATWEEKDARVILFAPDGRSFLTSGGEGCRLWDVDTCTVRATLAGRRDRVEQPGYAPDSRTLYAEVASDEFHPVGVANLMAWDVATGRVKATFRHVTEGMGGGHYALSADGSRLAFLENSDRLPMRVEWSKVGMDFGTFDIAFNVNPGLPRVVLWDVERWREIARVDGGLPLALSQDGQTLVTGDRDWKNPVAKVWDAPTGDLRSMLKDRSPGVYPIVLSPDGRFLASGDHETATLWNLADGRRWSLDCKGAGSTLDHHVFRPDGRLFFPGGLSRIDPGIGARGSEVPVYDLAVTPPRRLKLGVAETVISPDGRRYAVVIGERFKVGPIALAIRDLPSLREIGHVDADGLVGAGFSPDGRWLALLVGRHDGPENRYLLETKLVDPETAIVRHTIWSPGQTWGNYGWKFSPDGNLLAVHYRTGSNVSRAGDPDPSDRPMCLDLWKLPAR